MVYSFIEIFGSVFLPHVTAVWFVKKINYYTLMYAQKHPFIYLGTYNVRLNFKNQEDMFYLFNYPFKIKCLIVSIHILSCNILLRDDVHNGPKLQKSRKLIIFFL